MAATVVRPPVTFRSRAILVDTMRRLAVLPSRCLFARSGRTFCSDPPRNLRKNELGMMLVARRAVTRFLVLCLAGARLPRAHSRECNDSRSLAAIKAAPPQAWPYCGKSVRLALGLRMLGYNVGGVHVYAPRRPWPYKKKKVHLVLYAFPG